MRFSNRFLLSSAAFTFVLSASLFSTPSAVAMDEENNELHARKKIKLEDSSESTDPTPLFQLFSDENLKDARNEVFSYLDSKDLVLSCYTSSKDLKSLRGTNKVVNKRIGEYLSIFDKRGLEDKVWQGGFVENSPENYLFNEAVWHAYKHMVIVHERIKEEKLNEDELKTALEPLSNVVTYLKCGLFNKCPKLVENVSGFISDVHDFLMQGSRKTKKLSLSKDLENLVKNEENKAGRELVRQFKFLTEEQYGGHADKEEDPSLMGPVSRHFWIRGKRKELKPSPQNWVRSDTQEWGKQTAEQWDSILPYGDVLTPNGLRTAATSYAEAKNFGRAAELYEDVLKRYINPSIEDLMAAANANYGAENFNRSAELRERMLRRQLNPSRHEFLTTSIIYSIAKNFTRRAELLEEALKLDEYPEVEDFKRAANAHVDANNFTRAAELFDEVLKQDRNPMVLTVAAFANYNAKNFERAAELYEEFLKGDPNPTVQDFRNAACANNSAKNFMRAAELFEEALKRDPNSIEDVFMKAINANYQVKNFTRVVELCEEYLKRHSTRPDNFRNAAVAHSLAKNFTRAAELREEVLKRDPNPTIQDFRNAAMAHFDAKNFKRALECSEEVLERSLKREVVDYRNAALANFHVNNFTRAAELREEVLKRDPNPRIKDFTDALMVYEVLGNKERCEELKNKIKELDPSDKNPKLPNM